MSGYTVAPGVGWVLDHDTEVLDPPGTGESPALEDTAVDVWLIVVAGLRPPDVERALQELYRGDAGAIATATALVDNSIAPGVLTLADEEGAA